MEPLRLGASRSASTHSVYTDAQSGMQTQQAGRSTTNLAAQASAQSMREASRASRQNSRGPSRSASTTNLLKKKSRAQAAVTPETAQPSILSPPTVNRNLRQRSPHAPIVSSPLIPMPSNCSASDSGSNSRNETEEIGAAPPLSQNNTAFISTAPPMSAGSLHSARARPILSQPEMSQRNFTASLSRLSTPRSVRDLGSDYTRYFNPFATRNNSQNDLTTPLPRYNSSLHLQLPPDSTFGPELSKRLSDPFKDSKRLSNPFDSVNSSAPATPSRNIPRPAAAAVPTTPSFIQEADPEKAFFPYLDDRLAAPATENMLLYTDEIEDDDDMHMPMWDDDIRLKPKFKDHFTRDNIVSTFGLFFMVAGLLCIFVVLPVMSYSGTNLIPYSYDTPMDKILGSFQQSQPWATVNDKNYPLLANIRTGLIDPDTPQAAMTRQSTTGETLQLVFSDEFNAPNRTFYPGDDPFWYGFDGWYGATQDLEWYDPDAINTEGGTLQLQLDKFENHNVPYRSGMLHSWNQLCFKGSAFEVSASLPGPAGVHGLWPGVWTMGNLGRPGYLSTTDGMWPYTYNDCDSGITPNQSMTDGTSNLPGQRLPSCSCPGEDHPTPGTGRGAPEIDIMEASGDWDGLGAGVATQSFQVAPFDIFYYPNYDYMETPNYSVSSVNTYTGGPYQQAVSTTTMLNNAWYDGNEYQKYAFEYEPGSDENAFISWTVGDDEMMKFDARAIGPNGNVGQRLVSEEPMSMVMNLGISHSWVDINFSALKFPSIMRIDYVRIYQSADNQIITCDPPGYETTQYIVDHPAAYNNANYTHWSDVGYSWPKNSFMHGC